MVAVRSNNNITYRCAYHVVWCPKYRRPVITSNDPKVANPPVKGGLGPVDERLHQIIREVCAEHRAEIIELETMPDHVHLLVSVDPEFANPQTHPTLQGAQQ